MNSLPSSEFRKFFHRLTEPTAITVHGHVIGVYRPGDEPGVLKPGPVIATVQRAFRPAPKPSKAEPKERFGK